MGFFAGGGQGFEKLGVAQNISESHNQKVTIDSFTSR